MEPPTVLGRSVIEPSQPEDNRRCSNCGHPCWRCISFKNPPDRAELHEVDDQVSNMEPPTTTQITTTVTKASGFIRKKKKFWKERGRDYLGPRDDMFEAHILIPCGMFRARDESSTLAPATIFGIQSSDFISEILISKTPERLNKISTDFSEYERGSKDENRLVMICTTSIVLRDFSDFYEFFDETELISVDRKDKWKPCKEGPDPGGKYAYDWDLVPDVTYTVSIRMFSLQDRIYLLSTCEHFLASSDSVCPYLTIEYKCLDKSGKTTDAKNQTAAASVLWLHQRKQIRERLSEPLDDLRHYSIIFLDSSYVISETRFQGVKYRVKKLIGGNLTNIDDLNRYIAWSNAIHIWGRGPNATAFKKDIETFLQQQRALTLPDDVQTDTHPDDVQTDTHPDDVQIDTHPATAPRGGRAGRGGRRGAARGDRGRRGKNRGGMRVVEGVRRSERVRKARKLHFLHGSHGLLDIHGLHDHGLHDLPTLPQHSASLTEGSKQQVAEAQGRTDGVRHPLYGHSSWAFGPVRFEAVVMHRISPTSYPYAGLPDFFDGLSVTCSEIDENEVKNEDDDHDHDGERTGDDDHEENEHKNNLDEDNQDEDYQER